MDKSDFKARSKLDNQFSSIKLYDTSNKLIKEISQDALKKYEHENIMLKK